MENISFFPRLSALKNTASGHIESNPLEGEFKVFPAFAAGVMCTTKDMHNYLTHLGESFKENNGIVSHDVAVEQLHGVDLGSIEFMSASMGQGIFTIQAGDNKFMLHQGPMMVLEQFFFTALKVLTLEMVSLFFQTVTMKRFLLSQKR